MPSTATIEAIPIATPSADRRRAARRVRSPTLATRSRSAPAGGSRGAAGSAFLARMPAAARPRGVRRIRHPWPLRSSRPGARRGARPAAAASAAISRSWVITTTVVPCAFSACSSARISAPVAVSRLPVGSSASRIAGRAHERAGDRHALALAAGEQRRGVPRAVARGRPARAPRAAASRRRARASRCRAGRRRRSRARCGPRAGGTAGRRSRAASARSAARRRSEARATSVPAMPTVPELGRSSVPDDVQQRRLARPGRARRSRTARPRRPARSTPRSAWTPPG